MDFVFWGKEQRAKCQDLLGVETPSTSLFSGVKDETVLLFLLNSNIYVIREEVVLHFSVYPFVSWVSTFSSTQTKSSKRSSNLAYGTFAKPLG